MGRESVTLATLHGFRESMKPTPAKKPSTKKQPSEVEITPEEALKRLAHHEPWSPDQVMKVETREELHRLLRFYNKPLLADMGSTPAERGYLLEFIRPSLRYYCKKLNVEIPNWLEGDEHYGHGKGSPEEMEQRYGKKKIEPAKWDEYLFEDLEKKPKKKAAAGKPMNGKPGSKNAKNSPQGKKPAPKKAGARP
jgi:hypothetical protein